MDLTLDQALQKGVKAHKAGKIQEADRYYTAILKASPKHPDANHNMGVLAVGVGKFEAALPFFKTALEVKPSIAQYWLSYIDALIKLDHIEDAKVVFDQAKNTGVKGDVDGFDQIMMRLNNSLVQVENQTQSKIQKYIPTQPNILDELKLDQALSLAKKKVKDCLTEEAKNIYQDICEKFPKNKEALYGIKILARKNLAKNSNIQKPPQRQLQSLANLYKQGQYQETLNKGSHLLEQFPNSINLYNIVGASNKGLGKLDEAIDAYKKALTLNPDYAEAYNNMGNALKEQGKLEEAIEVFSKALSIKPDYADAYYNMGNALKRQGKPQEAIEAYTKTLSIKPNYAKAYNNMGNALKEQGKLEEAVEVFNKALSIKPGYAEAYYNMGNALQEQVKLEEAIEAYKKALQLKPDYAEAYNNMGNALKEQGKLEEAIEVYTSALFIKPDYADAYNNMGATLQGRGKIDEAIEAYSKALYIKPDNAETYWNLSGTAKNISEAKKWVTKCLKANPNHLEAKLTKSALLVYEGDKSEFNALLKSPVKDHELMRSFAWAFSLPKLTPLHFHRWAFFDHMTALSKKDRPFYEFGVWRGEAFRYLIKTFKKGFGFDTFEGLPEDWHNEKAGTYSSDGNVPKIDGGEFIVGKFEDTLPRFFAETRLMASIINFDADLYSSTICALNFAKPVIDQHTILIFDEFIINKNWEQDEYKALEEFCANNNYTYEVLAISFFTKQVAVKIIM